MHVDIRIARGKVVFRTFTGSALAILLFPVGSGLAILLAIDARGRERV